MPAVSVVMPVYNVEPYVGAALDSVLAQTFQDIEVIVVDDGCKDASIEVCESRRDPRVRIVRQANRGLAGARNTGIRHATGRYVALLDSDDAWHPEKLARHVQHLDERAEVGVSFSQSEFIDEAGRSLGYFQRPKLHGITPEDVLLRNPVGNGSAPVLRRRTLDAIRYRCTGAGVAEDWYFDESYRQSEDIECWLRIALTTAWRFEGIGLPLTRYRVNATGLSANLEKQLESWERLIGKTRGFAPEFIARHERLARAFQLRYLARRAVRQHDPRAARSLLARALREDWRVIGREPARTLVTGGAALLQSALPAALYRRLEGAMLLLAGRVA